MKTICERCNGTGITDTLSGRCACDTCCGVGFMGQDDPPPRSSTAGSLLTPLMEDAHTHVVDLLSGKDGQWIRWATYDSLADALKVCNHFLGIKLLPEYVGVGVNFPVADARVREVEVTVRYYK